MKPSPYDNPDYHALISGIREIDRAGGDSTLARLVTADWLEERNTGRWPQFIRTQCDGVAAAAPALLRLSIPGLNELASRGRWHCDYIGNRVTLDDADGYPVARIRRGFLDTIECALNWWLTHGPDICRRHPVREVVITDKSPMAMWVGGYNFTRHYGGPLAAAEWELPQEIFALMTATRFDDTKAASAALNAATLRWAEAEADRPA